MVALLIFVVAEFLHVGALANGPTSQPGQKTEKSSVVQPPNAANANNVRLDVEVVLAQTTIRPREEVTGKLKFTNSGNQRISIRSNEFPRAFARGLGGAKATQVGPRGFICGGTGFPNSPPVEFKPGDIVEHNFSIVTDPMSYSGGTTLTEGQFEILVPGLSAHLNIPTFVKPALLTVKAESSADFAPRRIRFGVGGRRLLAMYETGWVQILDIDSGSVVREFATSEYAIPESWEGNRQISPDGKYLVLLNRGSAGYGRGNQLLIYAIDQDRPGESVLGVPATGLSTDYPWVQPWLMGFSNDSRFFNVGSMKKFCQVDVTTGSISKVLSEDRASPIETKRSIEQTIYQAQDRKPINSIKGLGKIRGIYRGRRGLYVGWSDQPGLVLHDEDGKPKLRIASKGQAIVAESPDGRYIAVEDEFAGLRQETVSVEIWDVDSNSRRDTVEASTRAVLFTGNPVMAVVASRTGLLLEGVMTINDEFELRSLDDPSSIRNLRIPAPRIGK